MNNTVIVVGATGVVGLELIKQLCADDTFSQVVCLVRQTIKINDPKLTQHIVDFNEPKSWQHRMTANTVYCALGTTLKQAGNKTAQKKVDLDLPIAIAEAAKSNNACHYALVSSAGADASSSSFYLSLKGKLEQRLIALNFDSLTIVQPSVLDAERNEFRLGEKIAIKLLNILQFVPIFRQYKPITPAQVAKALIHFQQQNKFGVTVKKLEQLFI